MTGQPRQDRRQDSAEQRAWQEGSHSGLVRRSWLGAVERDPFTTPLRPRRVRSGGVAWVPVGP